MAIGNLDRCIVLQDWTLTQDSYGQPIESWTETAKTKAWVRYKSGNESLAANKETATADCIFTIRYRASITEKTRVIFDGHTYDIIHIAESGRRKYLDLTAKKVE